MIGEESSQKADESGIPEDVTQLSMEEQLLANLPNMDDGSEDDDSDSEEINCDMQLGFVEEEKNDLFHESNWTEWDGGKVGGKPVWLDPVNLPDAGSLLCQTCNNPLCFLLEIYCPLDNIDAAFHRALYVFCCRNRSCVEQRSGVKCFRVQLPRNNEFYSSDPLDETSESPKASVFQCQHQSKLCVLCGCKASNVCSKCKSVWYCGRLHQKLHWKEHKKVCSDKGSSQSSTAVALDAVQTDFLFPEYEIVVEPEELIDDDILNKATNKQAKIWDDAETKGGEDEAKDAKLTQKHYNQALSEQVYDPTYVHFLTRIDRSGKQQILRYSETSIHHTVTAQAPPPTSLTVDVRDRGRLYLTKEMKEESIGEHSKAIPCCTSCGAPRAFEFQIMPQLLHFLNVETHTKLSTEEDATVTADATAGGDIPKGSMLNTHNNDLDWGSLDIFTCSASCAASSNHYLEEFVFMQQLPHLEPKLQFPSSAATQQPEEEEREAAVVPT